ncbi:hypothetical protein, partial [Nitrosomonas sp.]|uniref:hypothetical protein n=1 Tax=Nitrosomonas sp. TaxID=42353 RepID=UPI00272F7742
MPLSNMGRLVIPSRRVFGCASLTYQLHLRNSHQTWNERTQGVFDESRSEYRHHLRSTHRAQWFLHLA